MEHVEGSHVTSHLSWPKIHAANIKRTDEGGNEFLYRKLLHESDS
jgi:hypothetical protein